MASPRRRAWVWANWEIVERRRAWFRIVVRSQRAWHDLATEQRENENKHRCQICILYFVLIANILNVHWKDWCWCWNSNTLATWCGELTHLKRPWCWERLKAGRGGEERGWDGWMASLIRWTWVWVNSSSSWWKGSLGVLQSVGLQRVRNDWVTELRLRWFSQKIYKSLVNWCLKVLSWVCTLGSVTF